MERRIKMEIKIARSNEDFFAKIDQDGYIVYDSGIKKPTRFYRLLRQNVEQLLRAQCTRIPFPDDAFHRLNDKNTQIYNIYIVRAKSDNPVGDCVRQLHDMECYGSSWYYLDRINTNSNTLVTQDEMELLLYAATDAPVDARDEMPETPTTLAYGMNEELADGEVEIIHVEYYTVSNPTREEVEAYYRKHVSLHIFDYDWDKCLKYLEDNPNLNTFAAIADVCMFIGLEDETCFQFHYNAIEWGLHHGWSPNEPIFGKTAIEHLDSSIVSAQRYHKGRIPKLMQIRKLLLQYGAKTLYEVRSQNPYYRKEDFYTNEH